METFLIYAVWGALIMLLSVATRSMVREKLPPMGIYTLPVVPFCLSLLLLMYHDFGGLRNVAILVALVAMFFLYDTVCIWIERKYNF
ncbi:hypothetical protein KBA63_04030 [Candidatus Woesebacteria bacterium]|nr:hypothetical protein [Candidatus Woesebacteria bacterium]MBP9687681.1 hypothetical protein [Candidatus Woesebacteria bacterium]